MKILYINDYVCYVTMCYGNVTYILRNFIKIKYI